MQNNRIGETAIMNCGEEATIIEYNNTNNIIVKFKSTGEIFKSSYSKFKNNNIKSHFSPTIYNKGIVGLERTQENGIIINSYMHWKSMLKRCYSEVYKKNNTSYKDVICCEEWLYYKSFKEWFDKNYYEINGKSMAVDKDIIFKGNKIYSPETCIIVPQNINSLFVRNISTRGEYPIGVSWNKMFNRYQAKCGQIKLGNYNTIEEAFERYKIFKENLIKEKAEEYKGNIPENLYNAMINCKVFLVYLSIILHLNYKLVKCKCQ